MTLVSEPDAVSAGEFLIPLFGPELLDDELLPRSAWRLLFELYVREANGLDTEHCALLSTPRVSAQAAQKFVDLLVDLKFIDLPSGPGRRFRPVSLSPEGFAALKAKMQSKRG